MKEICLISLSLCEVRLKIYFSKKGYSRFSKKFMISTFNPAGSSVLVQFLAVGGAEVTQILSESQEVETSVG